MSKKTPDTVDTATTEIAPPSRWNIALKEMLGGSVVISILSVLSALVVGAILIAVTDPGVHKAVGYFAARPT
ncbi:MAG: ABC transporter permease, partial [Aurantimicrobium sp.]